MKRHHIRLIAQLKITAVIVIALTMVETINLFIARSLNIWGILPRSEEHWIGIFAAPFLHGSVSHFSSNIIPLAVFSVLVLQHGLKRFCYASVFIILVTGVLVWLFGRPAIHVGASCLIYGYFGFLIVAGFVSREFKLIIISLLVGFLYGGMIWGVLPLSPYISFESHLFGALSGAVAGFIWGKDKSKKR